MDKFHWNKQIFAGTNEFIVSQILYGETVHKKAVSLNLICKFGGGDLTLGPLANFLQCLQPHLSELRLLIT